MFLSFERSAIFDIIYIGELAMSESYKKSLNVVFIEKYWYMVTNIITRILRRPNTFIIFIADMSFVLKIIWLIYFFYDEIFESFECVDDDSTAS